MGFFDKLNQKEPSDLERRIALLEKNEALRKEIENGRAFIIGGLVFKKLILETDHSPTLISIQKIPKYSNGESLLLTFYEGEKEKLLKFIKDL